MTREEILEWPQWPLKAKGTGPFVQCSKCDDIIRSFHRHDLVECKCGEIFVDGGSDYVRLKNPQSVIYLDQDTLLPKIQEEKCV